MTSNRRYIATVVISLIGAGVAFAQQIAVVSPSGTTSISQTLQQAIKDAEPGSVIYLPGGGFQVLDSVKITKKVSIVGIGHKAKGENADGNTVLGGNLFFNEGSTGSSVMGCYISGNVQIGYDDAEVHNIVVKYCNANSIQVKSNKCTGTTVNQCYLRNSSSFNSASAMITNNVISSVSGLNGGIVKNNVFKGSSGFDNCSISRNIFLGGQGISNNCISSENMAAGNVGDNPKNISEIGWEALFQKYNGGNVTPASNFQYNDDYFMEYRFIGLYGGTGFDDSCQPPLPFIADKKISGQTDPHENLNIKLLVKPGGSK